MTTLRGIVEFLAVAGALAVLIILGAGLAVRAHERWLDWRCDRERQARRKITSSPEYQKWYRLLFVAPNEEELAELRAWRVRRGFEPSTKEVQP